MKYEIVDEPPKNASRWSMTAADWDEVVRTAVECSPQWVAIPNMLRVHAQHIKNKEKASFRRYPGTWEAKTRKIAGDQGDRATLFVRYLP